MSKTGIELIAAERENQLTGWSAEHDDSHRFGELAKAAAVLAVYPTDAKVIDPDYESCQYDELGEIWGLVEKHKGDRVRQLAIAGALIAAELDRELRL